MLGYRAAGGRYNEEPRTTKVIAVGIEGLTPATAMNTAANFAVGDTLHNRMVYPTTDIDILIK